jgi:hypothetical protein
MIDFNFVLWYINKHYFFTGSKFKTKYVNGESFSYNEFFDRITNSLALDTLDNKRLLSNSIYEWYRKIRIESKIDILDFIKYKYKIRLGFRNWEIATMSGKTITIDNIVKDLKGKYDKEFIEPIIDEWFENQVINQSEKIILNFK